MNDFTKDECYVQGETKVKHTWSYRVEGGQCLNCGKVNKNKCGHESDAIFMDVDICDKCGEFYR